MRRLIHRLLSCATVAFLIATTGIACDEAGVSEWGDGGQEDGSAGGASGAGANGPGGGASGAGAGAGTTGGTSGGGTSGGGTSGGGAAGGSSPGTGGAGGAGTVMTPPQCPVQPSQCSDGKDNDGDGKVDALDPECVDPCDNDEKTFATGIPGDNRDDLSSCKQDCFFDGNSGADEGWQFPLTCDPARADQKQCRFDPNMKPEDCMPRESAKRKYENACRRITPNGCDCFGCCLIPAIGRSVRLTASCTAAAYNDPAKCQPCTQQTWCLNDCKECELCIGKTTLPATCMPKPLPDGGAGPNPNPTPGTDGGAGTPANDAGGSDPGPNPNPWPEPLCDPGIDSCGPGGDYPNGCPSGLLCITGCCLRPID